MIGPLSPAEYYRRIEAVDTAKYRIGQLCWAPCQYEFDPKDGYVLRSKYEPSRGLHDYRVDRVRLPGEFESNSVEDINHVLGLRSTERSLLVTAKRRPAIIMSQAPEPLRDGNRRPYPATYLVAPIYSFRGGNKWEAYSTLFKEKVKAYYFPQAFYLPEGADIDEGFVRLDRIQAIAAHQGWLEPKRTQLGEDALWLLMSWFRAFCGEELKDVNDTLLSYREDAIASLTNREIH